MIYIFKLRLIFKSLFMNTLLCLNLTYLIVQPKPTLDLDARLLNK